MKRGMNFRSGSQFDPPILNLTHVDPPLTSLRGAGALPTLAA
jgi:hypothetical protein